MQSISFLKQYKYAIWIFTLSVTFLIYQSQIAFNTDIITLVRFAERIYSGMPYLLAAYETNLPSSIILYLPVPAIMELGLNWFYATLLYGYILFGFLIWCNARYLKQYFYDVTHLNSKLIILYSFFMFCMGYGFFQKDYVIALLLIPYIAMEWISLVRKNAAGNVLSPGPIVMMSIACIIKPHYAIIPLFFYIWRFGHNLTSFITSHFTVPISIIVIVAGSYWIFFPQFYTIILQDIIKFYLGMPVSKTQDFIPNIIILYLISLGLIAFFISVKHFFMKEKIDYFIIFLSIGSILLFCVFLIQNKGFGYHLYPTLILSLVAFLFIVRYSYHINIGFIIITIIILCCFPIRSLFDHRHGVQYNLPLNQVMTDNYTAGTFIIPHPSMKLGNQLHGYSDFENVSRYPSFWTYILYSLQKDDEGNEADKRRHFEYFFEDLRLHEPDYVIIPYSEKSKFDYNLIYNYALKDPIFKNYWTTHYKKDRDGAFNIKEYKISDNEEIFHYEIYLRTSSKQ